MKEWTRINRWGLALLLPALLLAVGASSFRYVMIHERWFVEERTVQATAIVMPDPDNDRYPAKVSHEITLTPLLVQEVDSAPGTIGDEEMTAPPGTRLWHVRVRAQARQDMVLQTCVLALEDIHGRVYDFGRGLIQGNQVVTGFVEGSCDVGGDLEVPSFDVDGNFVPAGPGAARPEVWELDLYAAVPEEVELRCLRAGWRGHPDVWLVELPE